MLTGLTDVTADINDIIAMTSSLELTQCLGWLTEFSDIDSIDRLISGNFFEH